LSPANKTTMKPWRIHTEEIIYAKWKYRADLE
jgi:hypothetical protein